MIKETQEKKSEEVDLIRKLRLYEKSLFHQNEAKKIKEEFLERYKSMIYDIAKKYVSSVPMEDLLQEGYLAILEALDRFDPSYDTSFSTYVYYWIHAYLSRYFANSQKEQKNIAELQYTDGSDDEDIEEIDLIDKKDEHLDKEEADYIHQYFAKALEYVSPSERKILECFLGYMDGIERTPRETAFIFNISTTRVLQVVKKFKNILKQLIKEEVDYDRSDWR